MGLTKEKLTKGELNEVKLMQSYFGSLDLDVDSPKDIPKAEENFLKGLSKLIKNYEVDKQ